MGNTISRWLLLNLFRACPFGVIMAMGKSTIVILDDFPIYKHPFTGDFPKLSTPFTDDFPANDRERLDSWRVDVEPQRRCWLDVTLQQAWAIIRNSCIRCIRYVMSVCLNTYGSSYIYICIYIYVYVHIWCEHWPRGHVRDVSPRLQMPQKSSSALRRGASYPSESKVPWVHQGALISWLFSMKFNHSRYQDDTK